MLGIAEVHSGKSTPPTPFPYQSRPFDRDGHHDRRGHVVAFDDLDLVGTLRCDGEVADLLASQTVGEFLVRELAAAVGNVESFTGWAVLPSGRAV